VHDLPATVKNRIFFVRFEDLMAKPQETMEKVYQWLGLKAHKVDPNNLMVRPHESDSHFRFKYLHKQHSTITPPQVHEIPQRAHDLIKKACGWYYEWFYPETKKS
jgi:sulfotransferase